MEIFFKVRGGGRRPRTAGRDARPVADDDPEDVQRHPRAGGQAARGAHSVRQEEAPGESVSQSVSV